MKFRIPLLNGESAVFKFYKEFVKTLEPNYPVETFDSEHNTWKLSIERQMMILLALRAIFLLIVLVSAEKLSKMIAHLIFDS